MPERKVFTRGFRATLPAFILSVLCSLFCLAILALAAYAVVDYGHASSLYGIEGRWSNKPSAGWTFVLALPCLFALWLFGLPIVTISWAMFHPGEYVLDSDGIHISEPGYRSFIRWGNVEWIGVPDGILVRGTGLVGIRFKDKEEYIATHREREIPWLVRACNSFEAIMSAWRKVSKKGGIPASPQDDIRHAIEASRKLSDCDFGILASTFGMDPGQASEMLNGYLRQAVPKESQRPGSPEKAKYS